MRRSRSTKMLFALFLCTAIVLPGLQQALAQEAAGAAVTQQPVEPRPIELQDIAEWNRISAARLSNDGAWLAYRVAPAEGNGEVVVRSTSSDTEHRFPIGSVAGGRFAFGGGGDLAFSDDSAWVAFTIYPEFTRRRRERENGQPRNKLGLLDLGSGEMTEFDEVRSFAFSGESSGWLAMSKYPAGGGGGPAGGRGRSAGTGGGRGGPDSDDGANNDRPRGADLILMELSSGTQMNIGNVAGFEFNESGSQLAWTVDTASNAGNGVQVRDMDSGVVRALEGSDADYRSLNWTDEGDGPDGIEGR